MANILAIFSWRYQKRGFSKPNSGNLPPRCQKPRSPSNVITLGWRDEKCGFQTPERDNLRVALSKTRFTP
ncbi:MAG: hypothetical protein ACTHN5_11975 [Phycisphaerae bacterium]